MQSVATLVFSAAAAGPAARLEEGIHSARRWDMIAFGDSRCGVVVEGVRKCPLF